MSDATHAVCLTWDMAVGAGAADCPLQRQPGHIHRWEGRRSRGEGRAGHKLVHTLGLLLALLAVVVVFLHCQRRGI